MLPPVIIRKPRRPKPNLPSPVKPDIAPNDEGEVLTGEFRGMKASQYEERLVNELQRNKNVNRFDFRYTLGAPRGLSGWFELDVLAYSRGIHYAIEVDTEFSHRLKQRADKLHDARVIQALKIQGLMVYPEVIHLQGEEELMDEKSTKGTVTRLFG